jgi:L-asparaginase / beta-aspartyl-peptidase
MSNLIFLSELGHGESITKYCMAQNIINSVGNGVQPEKAVKVAIKNMNEQLNQYAGAIVVSNLGAVGFSFNTSTMPWCYVKTKQVHYGMIKLQHEVSKLEECS